MADKRYLIGFGERLSEDVQLVRGRPGPKDYPYGFEESRDRLAPQFESAAKELASLPDLALPANYAALNVTLHPTFLAMSYYPDAWVRHLGLIHLGSRSVSVHPDRVLPRSSDSRPSQQVAPQLILAGERSSLIDFSEGLPDWAAPTNLVEDSFRRIEEVGLPGDERVKALPERLKNRELVPIEVALHAPSNFDSDVVKDFVAYASSIEIDVENPRLTRTSELAFLSFYAPASAFVDLAKFSFLRVLRAAPRIAPLEPRKLLRKHTAPAQLPEHTVRAPDLAVAVFDGGLPSDHGLDAWVRTYDAPGVGSPSTVAQEHGLGVTSALLFGPIGTSHRLDVPFASVDHWRVLDEDDVNGNDDFECLRILQRIEEVLASQNYDFINISLGPDESIVDDDVSLWTARLDELLSQGTTLASVAAGNNGHLDSSLGLNRVQPPSDGVNVLAVGAGVPTSTGHGWSRAYYSACGPGRSPGVVKPDTTFFGGDEDTPFGVLERSSGQVANVNGTSYAAPLALRTAVGIRASFEHEIWAPTLKALLVHSATPDDNRELHGWGFVNHAVEDLVLCNDGEAHVIYQRKVVSGQTVRFRIPAPNGLRGTVAIRATLCFFSEVDPQDAINYTRSGLTVTFRPDLTKFKTTTSNRGAQRTALVPTPDSFFQAADYRLTERALRDGHKWETTLSAEKNKRATSLNNPVFDVSYTSRVRSRRGPGVPISLGLVISLYNKNTADLYNRVVQAYQNRLQPLSPRTRVPTTVQARV